MKATTVLSYISEFENAVRDDEMRGSFHPDIRDQVHDDYLRIKRKLRRAISELVQ